MITSRRQLAAITRTLEFKAEQARTADTGPTPRFDPTRRPSTVAEADVESPAGRRRLLPAAALIVVLGLVGAGVIVARRGENQADVSTITLGDPPAGWLVPSWLPEGMEPWGIEWSWESVPAQGTDLIPQLFGDPDADRAIYLTTSRYEVRADTVEQVTVRGQAGEAGRAWNVEETDVGDAIRWDERGVDITALYKGMTHDEAVAALDSLDWRSADPLDGFAPPSDGSWPLREVGSRQTGGRDLTLVYSDGAPAREASERLGLLVHTTSSSAISDAYLEGWYLKGSEAGGGEQPISTYDPDRLELRVVWPDGRLITVSPMGNSESQPSRGTMERIADSLTVATEADLVATRDAVVANVRAMPVVAEVATRIGTVEVHAESDFVQLCLRGASCRTDAFGGGSFSDGTAIVTAEWTIDGTWYIAVASLGELPAIVGGHDRTSAPDADPLPVETATAGDWTIRLVQPAADIEIVCTTDGSGMSCGHHRPG